MRATRLNNFVVDDDNAMCGSFAADSFHWLEILSSAHAFLRSLVGRLLLWMFVCPA